MAHCCPHTDNSAFCQITDTGNSAKSLAPAILPNHWHTPPHTRDNSAKSLAQQAILPNHWLTPQHTSNSAKSLAHCPHTGYSAKSLAQIILPNHWYQQFCQIGTGKSAKSLAHYSTYRKQFCQITGIAGNSDNFLACFSTYRQFCQITGTHCPHSGNSAKSLAPAILPNHWHRQICEFTGTLLHIQETILPNHWHSRQF